MSALDTPQQPDETLVIRVVIDPPPIAEIIAACGDPADLDTPNNQAILQSLLDEDEE